MQDDTVPGVNAGDRPRLHAVLTEARELGFLGPGPVDDHIDRSAALVPLLAAHAGSRRRRSPGAAVPDAGASVGTPLAPIAPSGARALDLGSGGGVPGLVLATALPDWTWVLLDGSVKRTNWLLGAVGDLALGDRVEVVTARAEDAGHSSFRGSFDAVVARSFAAPAPTAECAAPLLTVGGILVVTEPPGGAPDRWDVLSLDQLGLAAEASLTDPVALQVMRQVRPCPSRYPRRTGIPVKRPLWGPARP